MKGYVLRQIAAAPLAAVLAAATAGGLAAVETGSNAPPGVDDPAGETLPSGPQTPTPARLPQRLPPVSPDRYGAEGDAEVPPPAWWTDRVTKPLLDRERWVAFDLETLLLDTLAHSPRILAVGYQTSAVHQRIIQQDAAFDSTMLLGSDLGATNDPVGDTLTTGGADRLRERSLNLRGGARKLTRRGAEIEWSQQLGLLDSNSTFFVPDDQGNARLSLSLNKPLLSRSGRYYNERLVTQARIESRVAWQDMRGEVEQRIADVITAYWRLHQARGQLTQQRELLARSQRLERILTSRKVFDAARIEIVKARQRIAQRTDEAIALEAELKKQAALLAALVGSETLRGSVSDLELIPLAEPVVPQDHWGLRDAVAQALQNRPEVRAATHELELSALELRVTRVELEPQLNWVFNGYLAQLNGNSRVVRSFGEQFANAPGVSSGFEFEMPRGRRAFRARHREALLRARQRSEQLREVIRQMQFEVQAALIELDQFARQLDSKRRVLAQSVIEENILTTQWRILGGDDSRVGIKLENLLDAQQKRTDAEQALVAAEADYMIAMVKLQRAMGTLLIHEGVRPTRDTRSGEVRFLSRHQGDPPVPSPPPKPDAVGKANALSESDAAPDASHGSIRRLPRPQPPGDTPPAQFNNSVPPTPAEHR